MPINDPGNAGTASGENGSPSLPGMFDAVETVMLGEEAVSKRKERIVAAERVRRLLDLINGFVTAIAIVTGTTLSLLLESWTPAIASAAGFLAAVVAIGGIFNYRYGRQVKVKVKSK